MAQNSPYEPLSKPNGDYTMGTQAVNIQGNKDSAEKLVSWEMEREYQMRAMEKTPRGGCRRACLGLVLALLVALMVWLLTFTILEKMQLSQLKSDVDVLRKEIATLQQRWPMREMKNDLDELRMEVATLKQRWTERDLLNDVKVFENVMYADIEQSAESGVSARRPADSLEQLDGLTVLETEDADAGVDDEDVEDDYDDGESGDWYLDYDKKREKVGSSNMVKLSPQELAAVVNVRGDRAPLSSIAELRRMLQQDAGPTESARARRSVPSASPMDSVDAVDAFAAPRFVAKADESSRRKLKKYASLDSARPAPGLRTARNSIDDGISQTKPFIAAHFHGNTTLLNPEIHEHYLGNGLVRLAHDSPHNVWYPAPWTMAAPAPRPTLTRSGHVHVHHTGVYLVYVQIYYLDAHDVVGWVLHRSGAGGAREALLRCVLTAPPSPERRDKPNSCFSASALLLRAGDYLAVRNTGGDRHSLMEPDKSFIGLLKLADADLPSDEM